MKHKRLLISRTDSIGDVVLTLPMVGYLKNKWPELDLFFLGQKYTGPVVNCCTAITDFLDWSELKKLGFKEQTEEIKKWHFDAVLHVFPDKQIANLAKASGIKTRVGTTGRTYHWWTCNKRVKFTRRRSSLHESQLNFKLLRGLGLNYIPELEKIPDYYQLEFSQLHPRFQKLLHREKFNLIIHPKSKGSAVEWPEENYLALIEALPQDRFHIFITGTAAEEKLAPELTRLKKDNVTPLFGEMDLNELIRFIASADGLLAASTGPLHIAAAFGTHAMGLFAPQKPIHPGRWRPVGKNTHVFVRSGPFTSPVESIRRISVDEVLDHLIEFDNP